VDIRDGVITLRGVATSEATKGAGHRICRRRQRVLRVTNVMTVVKTPAKADETVFEVIDDPSITAQVKVALGIASFNQFRPTRRSEQPMASSTVSGIAKNAAEKALVTKTRHRHQRSEERGQQHDDLRNRCRKAALDPPGREPASGEQRGTRLMDCLSQRGNAPAGTASQPTWNPLLPLMSQAVAVGDVTGCPKSDHYDNRGHPWNEAR